MLIKFFTKKNLLIVFSAFLIMALFVGCPASSGSTTTDTPAYTEADPTYWSGSKLIGTEEFSAYNNSVAVDVGQNIIVVGDIRNDWAGVSNAYLDKEQLAGKRNFYVVKYNANGKKLWTRALGMAEGEAYATDVAVDATGDIYITGYTKWIDNGVTGPTAKGLDGAKCLDGSLPSGVYTAFLTKFDVNGVKQWTRLQGSFSGVYREVESNTVVVDDLGFIYISGYTFGNMGIERYPVTYTTDFVGTAGADQNIFISKFDSKGILVKTELEGQAVADYVATAMAYDRVHDQIIITGNATGTLYTAISGLTHTGATEAFILCIDEDLDPLTLEGRQVPAEDALGTLTSHSVAVDNSTSTTYVHIVGEATNGIGAIPKQGAIDAFWVKMTFTPAASPYFAITAETNNPNTLGSNASGTSLEVRYTGVVMDTLGNAIVTGSSTVSLGPNYATINGKKDVLLTQYPPNTSTTYLIGKTGEDSEGNAIAINTSNQVFIVGYTTGNYDGKIKIGGVDGLTSKFSIASSGSVTKY